MQFYNTAKGIKQIFAPIETERPKIYVCGPTVYNEIHVGNARAVVVFDLLFRIIKNKYENTQYVRNITDIDDKIIKKAQEENKTPSEIASFWEASFKQNCAKLNALPPNAEPKATETIHEMQEAIQILLEKGYAYISEGNILFAVKKLKQYGTLSGQNNKIEGARIAIAHYKEDAEDFILWKPSDSNTIGWESPWGIGRPGWHIECSAMSHKYLGETFDIHGGGNDLLFPHHENEQAQNIGLYGPKAGPSIWMHNAMVLFEGGKMSKSLGNIVKLSDAFQKFDPLVIRFFILSSHYRHPLVWSEKLIDSAAARWKRWMFHLQDFLTCEDYKLDQDIQGKLEDDLNTPEAFALLDKKLEESIKKGDKNKMKEIAATLDLLGCLPKISQTDISVNDMLQEREIARKNKDFQKADEIRAKIEEKGFTICDSVQGPFLKKIY